MSGFDFFQKQFQFCQNVLFVGKNNSAQNANVLA